MSAELLSFEARSIMGQTNYKLDISSPVNIIVGPNGSGKSTFLNIFYLCITRQWSRLLEYNFESVKLITTDGEIGFFRTELLNMDSFSRLPLRLKRYVDALRSNNELENFISIRNFGTSDRSKFSDLLGVSPSELNSLRNYIVHETSDLFRSQVFMFDAAIEALNLGRVLYLPTYRRIEKDLKSIFPDIEERVRARLSENQNITRQGINFQEIISFGMEDINFLISNFTQKLNNLSKTKSNDAAQEYIRDMVQGKIKDFSIGRIRDVGAGVIAGFVGRLDDHLLSSQDKEKLQKEITSLRAKKVGKPSKDMQYLGFFVEKMLGVYVDMQEAESPLNNFNSMITKYLSNNKIIDYKNYEFRIKDSTTMSDISLDDLSSGEKQIVSVFAYLQLRPDTNNIVIIDEPELSLSVPWQKRFLPDVFNTGRCSYLFAVTHSPFVFDNQFKQNIIDVNKLRAA